MLDTRLLLEERNDDRQGTAALVQDALRILPAMDRPSHWILALVTVLFAVLGFYR